MLPSKCNPTVRLRETDISTVPRIINDFFEDIVTESAEDQIDSDTNTDTEE